MPVYTISPVEPVQWCPETSHVTDEQSDTSTYCLIPAFVKRDIA